MLRKLISMIICLSILLTGCFSYSDIDKALFVTAVILDVDQDNMVQLYLECFLPYRSASKESAKGQRIVFKGHGNSVYEIMKNLNLTSSYKLNYTQNRAIIFTKKAAEFGINNFIDTFQRDQELLIRPYVLVYEGDPNKLIQMQLKEEEYIGVFLNNLIDNQKASSRTVQVRLNDFLDKRYQGSKVNVVTTVDIDNEQIDPKLKADGGSIIKEDKYVESIKEQDGEKYNFLIDKVNEGTLEPENPQQKGKFITLNINNSKTKTSLNFDGKRVYLKKIINTNVAIADIQGGFIINKDNIEKLKENSQENIRKLCTDFFNEKKKEKLDIFCVQEEFNRKYPKEDIKDVISITDLVLQVNVKINDTLDILDFK